MIYIQEKSMNKLREIVMPYMESSMLYKIKMNISPNTTYNTTKRSLSKSIKITDTLTGITTTYSSIFKAETALKAGNGSLNYCLKNNTRFKQRYIIKSLPRP